MREKGMEGKKKRKEGSEVGIEGEGKRRKAGKIE